MAYKQIRTICNATPADRLLNKVFLSHLRPAYVEIGDNNMCMPIAYKKVAERIHKFQIRDEDVILAAFPRTGTTWSQEMIWLIANDLDYEGAKEILARRFMFFETLAAYDDNDHFRRIYANGDPFQKLERLEGPRFFKTHLCWELLPEDITSGTKRPKIISVLRNPKDTCVSFYHLSKRLEGYKGTFEEFCELFLAGRVQYGPFWKSVLSYWKNKDEPNLLLIRYKDMIEDLPTVIKSVSTFLGKTYTEDQIAGLAQHLSFENMKKNESVNYEQVLELFFKPINMMVDDENKHIRVGKQDGYKSVMSEEMIRRFDEWTEENLRGSDLTVV